MHLSSQSPPCQQPTPLHQISPSGPVTLDADLCDILLLPKKQISKKRKKINKDLDPANKCITGSVFLEALTRENERKEKEAKEKEEKRLERQNKAKEKRERKEQKEKRAQERKAQKEKKEEEKRLALKKRKKSTQTKRTKRNKTNGDVCEEKAHYSCAKCGKDYQENDDVTWMECDYCSEWLHFTCTDLPVLNDLADDIVYTCEKCVKEGYLSHND